MSGGGPLWGALDQYCELSCYEVIEKLEWNHEENVRPPPTPTAAGYGHDLVPGVVPGADAAAALHAVDTRGFWHGTLDV